jgi:hypothetical protein
MNAPIDITSHEQAEFVHAWLRAWAVGNLGNPEGPGDAYDDWNAIDNTADLIDPRPRRPRGDAPVPVGWCHICNRDIEEIGDHAPGCEASDRGPEHPEIAPVPEYRVGQRLKLVRDVERFPHFIARAGMTGTVTSADSGTVCLRMDDDLPGAEEWSNEVVWSADHDETPEGDVEILATYRCTVVIDMPADDGDALTPAEVVEYLTDHGASLVEWHDEDLLTRPTETT